MTETSTTTPDAGVLPSYAQGGWFTPIDPGTPLAHAVTGQRIAAVSSAGLDTEGMLDYARRVGGPALRAMTFHQRAFALRSLAKELNERKEDMYELARATGDTRRHAWFDVDGGIQTLFVYASKGRRELPNDHVRIDGGPEPLGREGTFVGRHVHVPLRGTAVQINAFNFPIWGMLEKLAPAFVAGVPSVIKPASQTAYMAERAFRHIVATGLLPEGSVQLLAGDAGDLLDHVGDQDIVLFTGSSSTARKLRTHPVVVGESTRFNAEQDSLNFSLLGPDSGPDTEEFGLFVREVTRETTIKAGQRCTAIRRALVPRDRVDAAVTALRERLGRVVVGDPTNPDVTMGALASLGQRDEVRSAVTNLRAAGELVRGDPDAFEPVGADPEVGAFLPPTLLYCDDPGLAAPHEVEAFGPVTTVVPYDDPGEAAELAGRRGGGGLVGSVFTRDESFARDMVLATAPYQGRLLVLNSDCAGESTGHGSPVPHLVHGGPGRAGGGEELGGIRGVLHFMQRSALQGSPDMLTAVTGQWTPGARRVESDPHPFRKHLEDLRVGDTAFSEPRTVTLEDVDRFADLSGDRFYAHTDDEAAAANPFFDGRVAHGYLVVAMAAGLFVDPDPGPVLANYGLENLRFLTPVYPGDTIRVKLTCKRIDPREDAEYGEVRWDTDVTNQDDVSVANYDVLTLVAKKTPPG